MGLSGLEKDEQVGDEGNNYGTRVGETGRCVCSAAHCQRYTLTVEGGFEWGTMIMLESTQVRGRDSMGVPYVFFSSVL